MKLGTIITTMAAAYMLSGCYSDAEKRMIADRDNAKSIIPTTRSIEDNINTELGTLVKERNGHAKPTYKDFNELTGFKTSEYEAMKNLPIYIAVTSELMAMPASDETEYDNHKRAVVKVPRALAYELYESIKKARGAEQN